MSIKSVLRGIADNPLVSAVESSIGRGLLRKVSREGSEPAGRQHILLAAPGRGNIGDQAMLEAFTRNVPGEIAVIVRDKKDVLTTAAELGPNVRLIEMPGLLYGLPWSHLRSLSVLFREFRRAHSVSVVGADIMDGAYRNQASVRRFRIVEFAGSIGIPARVLGFSWNNHPTTAAAAAMRSASRQAQLMPRDPTSADRLLADGAASVTPVADIAFLTVVVPELASETRSWIRERRAAGRVVVVVNANYLLESEVDQVAAYSEFIRTHIDECAFVLLPHDSRHVPSDETLMEKIYRVVGDTENVFHVERVLAPGIVADLASEVDLVISGRMHLTIISATVGTPAITVSYQGKVEGLYKRFGIDTWITPGPTFSSELENVYSRVAQNRHEITDTLTTNVHVLKDDARRNLDGLGAESVAVS